MTTEDEGEGISLRGMPGQLSDALRNLEASGFNVDERPSAPPLPPPPDLAPLSAAGGSAGARPRTIPAAAEAMADRILRASRGIPGQGGSKVPVPSPVVVGDRSEPTITPDDDPTRRSTTTAITVTAPDRSSCRLSEGQSLVIGRLPGPGGLVIDNPEVSRRHVRLEVRMGMLVATELGSTNGTARVGRTSSTLERNVSQPLESGDRLVVNGDVLLCSVEITEVAS